MFDDITDEIRACMEAYKAAWDEDEIAALERKLDHLLWRERQVYAMYDY